MDMFWEIPQIFRPFIFKKLPRLSRRLSETIGLVGIAHSNPRKKEETRVKKSLTLLLASLMLAVGLTACGGDTRQDYHQTNDGGQGITGNSGGDSLLDDAERGVNRAVQGAENAMDDLTGNQQLRNGPAWNGNLNGPSPASLR